MGMNHQTAAPALARPGRMWPDASSQTIWEGFEELTAQVPRQSFVSFEKMMFLFLQNFKNSYLRGSGRRFVP